MPRLSYRVIFEPAEEGGFAVYVPGCISEGDTYQEALHNIKEAIVGWIEVCRKFGDEVPPSDVIVDSKVTADWLCHRDACWKSYDSEKRDATENDGICTRSQRDQEKDVEEHFAPGWLHCRRVHQPGMRHG